MNFILGNTVSMAEKSLDYLWQKQQVTMTNIANVDTPGYKAKSLTFEAEFRKKLEAASRTGNSSQMREAINSVQTTVQSAASESARLDENNVNMDTENVELTRTTLQYQYELNAINSDFSRYRTVIKG